MFPRILNVETVRAEDAPARASVARGTRNALSRVPFALVQAWCTFAPAKGPHGAPVEAWIQACWIKYKGGKLYIGRESYGNARDAAHGWGPWRSFLFEPLPGCTRAYLAPSMTHREARAFARLALEGAAITRPRACTARAGLHALARGEEEARERLEAAETTVRARRRSLARALREERAARRAACEAQRNAGGAAFPWREERALSGAIQETATVRAALARALAWRESARVDCEALARVDGLRARAAAASALRDLRRVETDHLTARERNRIIRAGARRIVGAIQDAEAREEEEREEEALEALEALGEEARAIEALEELEARENAEALEGAKGGNA